MSFKELALFKEILQKNLKDLQDEQACLSEKRQANIERFLWQFRILQQISSQDLVLALNICVSEHSLYKIKKDEQ